MNGDHPSKKLYIHIVYVIDFLVISRFSDHLLRNDFKLPILIAIYSLISINIGDFSLSQSNIWCHF